MPFSFTKNTLPKSFLIIGIHVDKIFTKGMLLIPKVTPGEDIVHQFDRLSIHAKKIITHK